MILSLYDIFPYYLLIASKMAHALLQVDCLLPNFGAPIIRIKSYQLLGSSLGLRISWKPRHEVFQNPPAMCAQDTP